MQKQKKTIKEEIVWTKTKHKGFWATFTEDQLKLLKDASYKMSKVLRGTNANNRDTQILEQIIKELDFIIDQQYD